MSSLRGLFLEGRTWLGEALRGASLEQRFRTAFDGVAVECLGELEQLVAASLKSLGLAAWPGGRLGPRFAEFASLGEPDAAAALAMWLLSGGGRASEGDRELGWLAGSLFRGGRVLGYLRAAEEDGEKALAILRLNIRRELQKLRDAADPISAALFDNLRRAAREASEAADLCFLEEQLVLARGQIPRRPEDGGEGLFRIELVERGSLEAFDQAVARNEARDEGQRNLPLRGEAFEAPLVAFDIAWAGSEPPRPGCLAVHIGRLSNLLREAYPPPASLREVPMPTDDEGRALLLALAPGGAAGLVEEGPGPLLELLGAWAAALDGAAGLSAKRRAKLERLLGAVRDVLLDSLGQPPPGWQRALRLELGFKPQTFSDDWKLLTELCPRASMLP